MGMKDSQPVILAGVSNRINLFVVRSFYINCHIKNAKYLSLSLSSVTYEVCSFIYFYLDFVLFFFCIYKFSKMIFQSQ